MRVGVGLYCRRWVCVGGGRACLCVCERERERVCVSE